MYNIETGAPLSGARLLEIQAFLARRGLTMEGAADFYVALREEDGTPLRGEISVDGENILTAEFTSFAFYDTIEEQGGKP